MPDTPTAQSALGTKVHASLAMADQTKAHEGLDIEEIELADRCTAIENKLLAQYFGGETEAMTANPVREKRYWAQWIKHKRPLRVIYGITQILYLFSEQESGYGRKIFGNAFGRSVGPVSCPERVIDKDISQRC